MLLLLLVVVVLVHAIITITSQVMMTIGCDGENSCGNDFNDVTDGDGGAVVRDKDRGAACRPGDVDGFRTFVSFVGGDVEIDLSGGVSRWNHDASRSRQAGEVRANGGGSRDSIVEGGVCGKGFIEGKPELLESAS